LRPIKRFEEALEVLNQAMSVLHNRSFFYESELHRLRGVVMLERDPDSKEASAALQQALEVAEKQGATALAARANGPDARAGR
jgi:hypothetical protein